MEEYPPWMYSCDLGKHIVEVLNSLDITEISKERPELKEFIVSLPKKKPSKEEYVHILASSHAILLSALGYLFEKKETGINYGTEIDLIIKLSVHINDHMYKLE